MENDTLPLYPESYSHLKVSTRHMDNAHADGIILTNQNPHQNLQVALGPKNTTTTCQYCRASVRTSVRHTSTTRTHMTAALFCFICCCCCLPYFMKSAKNCDHYCPNCAKYLGTYEK